ncbi:MAG: UDP-N-acetylmuramate dehydrogenase [Magnetococcales bacterium]|nr:UDP-N-acetylmuramate dehydrogenase [Magnetococcales bacterium]
MNPFAHLSLATPVVADAPLAERTTWRMGGPARWLITPSSVAELSDLLARWPVGVPRQTLGGGSNLLIADKGFDGAVLDLTRGLNRIYTVTESLKHSPDAPWVIHADAGATTQSLAHFARRLGLTGAEFLAGIPGSVGGALRMNAGAYGGEIKDLLLEAEVLDSSGSRRVLDPVGLGLGYRQCECPGDWIFTSARFVFLLDDPQRVRERMRAFNQRRRLSQPLDKPSAGSVFKNPPTGEKAWALIEQAGLRGARVGNAQVSTKHCNFFVNLGGARATDMRALIHKTQTQVEQHSGILLEPEVKLVGWE